MSLICTTPSALVAHLSLITIALVFTGEAAAGLRFPLFLAYTLELLCPIIYPYPFLTRLHTPTGARFMPSL